MHILCGIIIIFAVEWYLTRIAEQPQTIILKLISSDTIELSASLLGFQLAGVSVLIALNGNEKLADLEQVGGDTMIYKVFLSSISMFLVSIILMIPFSTFCDKNTNELPTGYLIIGYASLIALLMGFVFLFSSIKLLRYLCSKKQK